MAIRVRCPRCWETAEVPDDARGKQGKCNSCGAMVTIPEQLTKVCFICGADVTHARHAKDGDNNYICHNCFESRNPAQQAIFSVPHLECTVCHDRFLLGEGFERGGEPICRSCHKKLQESGRDREEELPPQPRREEPPPPAAAPAAAPAAQDHDRIEIHDDHRDPDAHVTGFETVVATPLRPRRVHSRSSPVAVVLALAALAAVAVGYFKLRGDPWERDNGPRIIALKAQAEILASLDRPRAAIDKYNELFRLVNGRPIRSETLNREIEAARAAVQVVSAAASADPPDTWESENAMRLLMLKGQADLLLALERPREAADRYQQVLKLASGHTPRTTALAEELALARTGLRQAQDLEKRIATAQAQANVKPPDPVRVPTPAPTTRPVNVAVTNPPATNVATTQPADATAGAQDPDPDPGRPHIKSIFDDDF